LEGADAKCQALANATTPLLPGTYKAWLSDATDSPSTRFRCTQASCSSQGYRLVDGITVVANDWAQLTSCSNSTGLPCLSHAIDRSEVNGVVGASRAWTHTNPGGELGGAANAHCQNWGMNNHDQFGDQGFVGETNANWTELDEAARCDEVLRLYCFQQS
jgi:hypothetical protein